MEEESINALATAKMEKDAEKKIQHLSKGMLQRVGIACVLVVGITTSSFLMNLFLGWIRGNQGF